MQFLNRVFNRQAMAIPARHVNRIQALELARFDDHVFQDFVNSMADVNLAIGIRRAIMQYEFDRTCTRNTQLFINAFVVPVFDPACLTFGQIAAHGKWRVGQVQGAAVVGFWGVI